MAESSDTLPDHPDCLNCGTELRGQYCASCGQRASNRLISIWELLRDAFGDLLELDSRLWRTVIPLLVRPGLLTHDYLIGRRARYMPPFRMYLVLSVIFFVVAVFDPRDDMSLLFEPEPEPTAEEQVEQERTKDEALEKAQEKVEELAEEGKLKLNAPITDYYPEFELDKVVPETVSLDTKTSYFVRIMSDEVMLKARKNWAKFIAKFEKH